MEVRRYRGPMVMARLGLILVGFAVLSSGWGWSLAGLLFISVGVYGPPKIGRDIDAACLCPRCCAVLPDGWDRARAFLVGGCPVCDFGRLR